MTFQQAYSHTISNSLLYNAIDHGNNLTIDEIKLFISHDTKSINLLIHNFISDIQKLINKKITYSEFEFDFLHYTKKVNHNCQINYNNFIIAHQNYLIKLIENINNTLYKINKGCRTQLQNKLIRKSFFGKQNIKIKTRENIDCKNLYFDYEIRKINNEKHFIEVVIGSSLQPIYINSNIINLYENDKNILITISTCLFVFAFFDSLILSTILLFILLLFFSYFLITSHTKEIKC